VTSWLNTQLQMNDHEQAFVFQHKNLLGQNHKDNMFGGSNDANTTQQNNFLKVLEDNNVRYDISGHDHMHHQSVVASPDGTSSVHELICASDSYKYYTPGNPFSSRDNSISEQLYKTGYYIFTVDGPRVTGKYYETTPLSNGDVSSNASSVVWTLSETFGYSLNGKEFLIGSGGSFNSVVDSYHTTAMSLAGTNSSTAKTADGRLVSKDVNTGWTDRDNSGEISNILTLWGLQDIDQSSMAGAGVTLTLSYDTSSLVGAPYIVEINDDKTWTPLASVVNLDGTVSATITGDGNYVVVPEPASLSLIGLGALGLLARKRKA
jgi:hypothetical protein